MGTRKLQLFVFSVYLIVSIIEYLPSMLPIRLLGQNILNERIWQIAVVTIILLTDPKGFFSLSMLIIYAWIAVFWALEGFGHYIVGFTDVSNLGGMLRTQHFSIATILLLYEHLLRKQDTNTLRKLIKVALIAYAIQCVIGVSIIARNPWIVRGVDWASGTKSDVLGAGSYVFYTSLPFIIPGVVFIIKNIANAAWKKKAMVIMFLVIVLFSSYMGVIVAPFLMSLLLAFLAFIGLRRLRANFVLLVVLGMILIITPKSIIGDIFFTAAVAIPNKEISQKTTDIGIMLSEGADIDDEERRDKTSIENRASRIPLNLRFFVSSPLIGRGVQGNAHLYWLNMLAQYGLIGTLPLIWILWIQFKKNLAIMSESYKYYYYLAFWGFITMGLMKAIGGNLMWVAILFIAPAMDKQVQTKPASIGL